MQASPNTNSDFCIKRTVRCVSKGVILEIEGNAQQRYKRAPFP